MNGFGDPEREFWLGLDKLVSLTNEETEMLLELETFEVNFNPFSWGIGLSIIQMESIVTDVS